MRNNIRDIELPGLPYMLAVASIRSTAEQIEQPHIVLVANADDDLGGLASQPARGTAVLYIDLSLPMKDKIRFR